ncbi:uncharacterized protein LOC110114167 [Dendrobium catenatum]|uniref:uncharacterized protein LOC110114167 n=1 Tax=Dendrobium catenatum TaxID=906689 RepID=UPI0009F2DC36|nr:uncharacterized protein LOC110114167 [Dendrobium catenatum]
MPTILRNGSKRVGFSPHNTYDPKAPKFLRSYIDEGKAPNRYRSSPARLLRHIKANVARTFSLFSTKRTSCSRNGPADPIPIHFIPPRDSHHSEALEDCIEFINSSHRKSL